MSGGPALVTAYGAVGLLFATWVAIMSRRFARLRRDRARIEGRREWS